MDPLKRVYLEDAYVRIKKLIKELEYEIGVKETYPVNKALLEALAEIEKLGK
jgi:hypothetical protein